MSQDTPTDAGEYASSWATSRPRRASERGRGSRVAAGRRDRTRRAPAPAASTLARRLAARAVDDAAPFGIVDRARLRHPLRAARWRSGLGPGAARSPLDDHRPARLPGRARGLRLLGLLDLGRPTRPEDHSGHGADSWRDYFRDQHRPQGDRRPVPGHDVHLLPRSPACSRMFMRAELASPGRQYVNTQTFNGLVSSHAGIMIFLFIVPVFAGFGNYVIPLMIGAPDMAFPRLNALSFWLLPIAGLIMLSGFLLPGGAVRGRLDELPAACRPEPGREPHVPDGRAVGRCVARS